MRLLLFVIVVSSLALVAGCLNEPNPVGGDLLPPTDRPALKTDTVLVTSDSLVYVPLNSSSDIRMFVGSYQNYSAWSFVEFGFTQFDAYKSYPIISAQLQIKANYRFGGTASPLSVQLWPAKQNWHSDSLTLDSLNADPTTYFTIKPAGGATSALDDTSWFNIAITDTAALRSSITGEGTDLSYGLLIEPLSTNGIKGFVSGNLGGIDGIPQVAITFDSLGTPATFSIPASQSRSLTGIPASSLKADPLLLYVQNGVSYREFLGFDMSHIPKGSSVSKAELLLTLNVAASERNLYTADSLITYFVGNDTSLVSTSVKYSSRDSSAGGIVFRFSIASYAQNWLVAASVQQRLALTGFSERTGLDRFVFYGKNWSQASLRPRLIISYNPPPQKRRATQ